MSFYGSFEPRGQSRGFPEAAGHDLPKAQHDDVGTAGPSGEMCPHPSREDLPSTWRVRSADDLSVPSESASPARSRVAWGHHQALTEESALEDVLKTRNMLERRLPQSCQGGWPGLWRAGTMASLPSSDAAFPPHARPRVWVAVWQTAPRARGR